MFFFNLSNSNILRNCSMKLLIYYIEARLCPHCHNCLGSILSRILGNLRDIRVLLRTSRHTIKCKHIYQQDRRYSETPILWLKQERKGFRSMIARSFIKSISSYQLNQINFIKSIESNQFYQIHFIKQL